MVRKIGYPKPGDFVIVTVDEITEFAAWCKLDEYPHLRGMIHVSEVAGRWVRNIREFVRVGKQYVAKVMKVEPERNFVSLSLKRVSRFNERKKWNEYRRDQRAEKILELAAESIGKNLDQAYEEVGNKIQEKYGSLANFFEEALEDESVLDELDEKWRNAIKPFLERMVKEKIFEIKAEVKAVSLKSNGVGMLKKALEQFEKAGFNVTYIAAGKYLVRKKTQDPKSVEKELNKIAEKIKKSKLLDEFSLEVVE